MTFCCLCRSSNNFISYTDDQVNVDPAYATYTNTDALIQEVASNLTTNNHLTLHAIDSTGSNV